MGKYIEVGLLMDNLKDGNVKDYEAVKEAVDNTPIAFDTDRVRAVEFMENGRVKKAVEKKDLARVFQIGCERNKKI